MKCCGLWIDHILAPPPVYYWMLKFCLQADERAVLKHFKWPEKKADAMREAAIEYRALKLLENEISLYKDDTNSPCEAALKKMASLLDKLELQHI